MSAINRKILSKIEQGCNMIRETKKKTDEVYIRVRLESYQIVYVTRVKCKTTEIDEEAVAIDISQINDVRNSKGLSIFTISDNMNKSVSIPSRKDSMLEFRFSIHYGNQFKLKKLILRAPTMEIYLDWLSGLKYLTEDVHNQSFGDLTERWLWKQYYEMGTRIMDMGNEGPIKVIDVDVLEPQDESSSNNKSNSFTINNKFLVEPYPKRRNSWTQENDTEKMDTTSLTLPKMDKFLRNTDIKIAPRQLRLWLLQAKSNLRITIDQLREFHSEYYPKPNYVDYKGLFKIYKEILMDKKEYETYVKDRFRKAINGSIELKRNSMILTVTELEEVAHDDISQIDAQWIQSIIEYNKSPPKIVGEGFSADRLYSYNNSIWDLNRSRTVYQNMDQPLSHYYINTSHNSYLTGDQIKSKSSCEAYVRCLQMGCRSVELDTWDGDKEPIIYHGNTFTSKIKFIDVIKKIQTFAWDKSKYPLILSFEDHCSVHQQTLIAQLLQETFGEDLLTVKVKDIESNTLPSPNQLTNKIIIKHKELPIEYYSKNGDTLDETVQQTRYLYSSRMFMKTANMNDWQPYYFIITHNNKLIFSKDDADNESDNIKLDETLTAMPTEDGDLNLYEEIHEKVQEMYQTEHHNEVFGNGKVPKWYFGNVSRVEATEWLMRHRFLGDGLFMIRKSESNLNNYSLSFYRQNVVHHVKIHSHKEKDPNQLFYGFEQIQRTFPSLTELVNYYEQHNMVTVKFHIRLNKPAPQRFVDQLWFHENPPMNKALAEDWLNQSMLPGAFLVYRKRITPPSAANPANASTPPNSELLHTNPSATSTVAGVANSNSNATNGSSGITATNNTCIVEEKFVLFFKSAGQRRINHVKINYDNFYFTIDGNSSVDLVHLIDKIIKNPSKNITLIYPINYQLLYKYKEIQMQYLPTQKPNDQDDQTNYETSCSEALIEYTNRKQLKRDSSIEDPNIISKSNHKTVSGDHEILNVNRTKSSSAKNASQNPMVVIQLNSQSEVFLCYPTDQLEGLPTTTSTNCQSELSCDSNHSNKYFPMILHTNNQSPEPYRVLNLACSSSNERDHWIELINEKSQRNGSSSPTFDYGVVQHRTDELQHKIAKSLSDLIVYCSAVPFKWPNTKAQYEQFLNQPARAMSSIGESKFLKIIYTNPSPNISGSPPPLNNNNNRSSPPLSNSAVNINANDLDEQMITKSVSEDCLSLTTIQRLQKYHKSHLSRVYPKASRMDSSNLDPMYPWYAGAQMVALNFQTPDKYVQLNQALFKDNGGCGYVLKHHKILKRDISMELRLSFLGARFLPKLGKTFVEIEVISPYEELEERITYSLKSDITVFEHIPETTFCVKNLDLTFIRFAYGTEDSLYQKRKQNCYQAIYPIRGLQPGIKSVHLKNGFSYNQELTTLLFHVDIQFCRSSKDK